MFCLLSLHQIFIAFVVLVTLLTEEIPIPDNILREMVMQTIDKFDLPPLSGKKRHQPSLTQSNQAKKTRIQYDYKRAEESVLGDWVGAVP
jgi:hypothetical protein